MVGGAFVFSGVEHFPLEYGLFKHTEISAVNEDVRGFQKSKFSPDQVYQECSVLRYLFRCKIRRG